MRTLVIPFCVPFFAGLRTADYSTVSVFDWPVLGGFCAVECVCVGVGLSCASLGKMAGYLLDFV